MKQKLRKHEAKIGWLGLTAYVIAWDAYALKYGHKTLSAGFSSGMQKWPGKVTILTIWFIITKHLAFNSYFKQLDPIQLAADKLRGKWSG